MFITTTGTHMLGDDVARALPEFRAQAESMMWDSCEIRAADSWVGETRQPGAIAWSYLGEDAIPCRVTVDGNQPRSAIIGGQEVTLSRLVVKLSLDVRPTENQVLTVLSAATDPSLVGRRFDVGTADVATYQRRVSCTENLG